MSTLADVAQAYCRANGHLFLGQVGVGAFKQTFHVILATGEPQALKVFQPGFSPERTARELEAMRRCSHPNISHLTSIADFCFEGLDYLLSVEEFLSGGTLTSRLQCGLLARADAVKIANQLVSAVTHIASHDLVHRDIKPDNILFREDGATPVIVDFGLVRDLGSSSLTQTWLLRGPGTPFFASPEQLRNEKALIDWRSDQFSLGVVLSLAIFGFHPYQEEGAPPERTVERVSERIPQTERFSIQINRERLPFLAKMTATWPVERFRRPEDLQRVWEEASL